MNALNVTEIPTKRKSRKRGPKSKAAKFTAAKFSWLEQLATETRLPPLALRLCVQLCPYFNLDYDGAAWPSQDTLAAKLGVRREAINKTLKVVVALGYLESTRRGPDKPNVYRMVLRDGQEHLSENPKKDAPNGPQDVRQNAHHPTL